MSFFFLLLEREGRRGRRCPFTLEEGPPRFFLPAFSLLVRRACQCRPCPLYKKDSDRVSNSFSKGILHM